MHQHKKIPNLLKSINLCIIFAFLCNINTIFPINSFTFFLFNVSISVKHVKINCPLICTAAISLIALHNFARIIYTLECSALLNCVNLWNIALLSFHNLHCMICRNIYILRPLLYWTVLIVKYCAATIGYWCFINLYYAHNISGAVGCTAHSSAFTLLCWLCVACL